MNCRPTDRLQNSRTVIAAVNGGLPRSAVCRAAALLVTGAAIFLPPVEASAQAWQKRALQRYSNTKTYLETLQRALVRADERNRPECARRTAKRTFNYLVVRLGFDKRRRVRDGLWAERIEISGCGPTVTYRIWFRLKPGAKLIAFAGVPGNTEASMDQMRAGMERVMALAGDAVLGCDRIQFRGTRVARRGTKQAPRIEIWQTQVCGRPFRFRLEFPADTTQPPTASLQK